MKNASNKENFYVWLCKLKNIYLNDNKQIELAFNKIIEY